MKVEASYVAARVVSVSSRLCNALFTIEYRLWVIAPEVMTDIVLRIRIVTATTFTKPAV